MFQVRAAFTEQLEVRASLEKARAFFADLRNVMEMMPGVERITSEAGGVMRWLIRAEIPAVGSMRQAFAVEQASDAPERIEWVPSSKETQNFLRYTATFEERDAETTLVRIEQRVELRREHARQLHMLAGLVGSTRLSAELQKGVTAMMRAFLGNARARLEK